MADQQEERREQLGAGSARPDRRTVRQAFGASAGPFDRLCALTSTRSGATSTSSSTSRRCLRPCTQTPTSACWPTSRRSSDDPSTWSRALPCATRTGGARSRRRRSSCMPRDVRAYLYDIAEACRLVDGFTRGRSADDYAQDSAPARRGGAGAGNRRRGPEPGASQHPAQLTDLFPEAPRIIAFRNRLAHGYASTVDEVVWTISQANLPGLRARVDALLRELDAD